MSRRSSVALILSILVVSVGCSGSEPSASAPDVSGREGGADRGAGGTVEYGGGVEAFSFDAGSISDLAGSIVIGTVENEYERADGSEKNAGPGESYTSLRDLILRVDEVIKGDESIESIVLADQIGWIYNAADSKDELVEYSTRMRPGDRVLAVLVPAPNVGADSAPAAAGPRYRLLTQSSWLHLVDGSAVITERPEPYLNELEGLTEQDLIAHFDEVCGDGCDRLTYPSADSAAAAPQ